jgi:hypothetical protein
MTTKVTFHEEVTYFSMTEYSVETMPVPTETAKYRLGFIEDLRNYIKSPKELEKIDEAANRASLLEAERAIDEYVSIVVIRITKLGEETKKELPSLTPEQRKDVLAFWQGASFFMNDILEWLQKAFMWMMGKIRQGLKMIAGSVLKFFDMVMAKLEGFFHK